MMKTAKFWFYWQETETLLKLKNGQELTLWEHWEHDEGYETIHTQFYRSNNLLIQTVTRYGRDCDGHYREECRLIALAGSCPRPNWRKAQTSMLDYTAIAANY